MTNLPSRLVQIRIRCGARQVNAFWVSFQVNGDVSIGSSDRALRVRRISKSSKNEISEELVENPHVTFHQPHWTHLRGNRGAPLWEALTWAAPEPGAPPASWIEIITSPINKLREGQNRRGQSIEIWPVEFADCTKSVILFVDFADRSHAENNQSKRDKYIVWDKAVFRFRVAVLEGQEPNVQVFTWG